MLEGVQFIVLVGSGVKVQSGKKSKGVRGQVGTGKKQVKNGIEDCFGNLYRGVTEMREEGGREVIGESGDGSRVRKSNATHGLGDVRSIRWRREAVILWLWGKGHLRNEKEFNGTKKGRDLDADNLMRCEPLLKKVQQDWPLI